MSFWRFNEGRGTVTVDAASWPFGGVYRFGVLTPAVAPSFSFSRNGEPKSDGEVRADWNPERRSAPPAAWAVSTAPEGGFAQSVGGRPAYLRLNGTDAHLRRLTAVLTRVPLGGNLSVAVPIGASTAQDKKERLLHVGDSVPVGTRLVYRPEPGAHDAWPGEASGQEDRDDLLGGSTWSDEAFPHEWLSYRVETEGGDISINTATVALSVQVDRDDPHLVWPSKVCQTLPKRSKQTTA